MRTETKRRVVHYKRAVLLKNDQTIQELLNKALSSRGPAHKASARQEMINPETKSIRMVNHFTEHQGMFFGQLVYFEPGKAQPLISVDDDESYYNIDSITTDSINQGNETFDESEVKKKIRKEFVESILYYGVLDNHIAVVQSKSLSSRDLETHLSWLLGSCTNLIDKNCALILQDKPSEKTYEKLEKSSVKKVSIGTPIETKDEIDTSSIDVQDSHTEAKKVRWKPHGQGADLLRAILGENWLNTMKLEDSLDDANLQVYLEVSYFRKTTKNGQRVLDNIATSLRHFDEGDACIHLNGGGIIRGDDLKLSGPVSVKTINGLVDETDLYHQMHNWLVTKVSENEIEFEVTKDTD